MSCFWWVNVVEEFSGEKKQAKQLQVTLSNLKQIQAIVAQMIYAFKIEWKCRRFRI